MTNIYSNTGFTRKVKCIKDWMDADGFYSDTMLSRVVVKSDASGLFNKSVTISYTDKLIPGIVVHKSEFVGYDEDVITVNADAQFTCKVEYKAAVQSATELWLNYKTVNDIITSGTMYEIKSSKPSLYKIDEIFELVIAGKYS